MNEQAVTLNEGCPLSVRFIRTPKWRPSPTVPIFSETDIKGPPNDREMSADMFKSTLVSCKFNPVIGSDNMEDS